MCAIDRGRILLRSIKLKWLNRSNLILFRLGHVHDYDMSVELRRGISVFMIWPRRRVLELCGDHLAGSDRWFIPAASGLYVSLKHFQGFLYAFSVSDSYSFVVANKGRKRN